MRSYVVPVAEMGPKETVSFVSVVNFALRNVLFIIAGGVLFAVLLAVPSLFAPRTYSTTTTFITESEQPAGRFLGGITIPGTGGRGPDFYIELMRSPAILGPLVEQRVQADSGKPAQTLIERYGGGQAPQVAREVAMQMVSNMMSTKVSLTGTITLRVTAETPLLAAGVAQAILAQIDDFNDTRRKTQASAERRFAEQRLVEIGAELRASEERWRIFLERNRETSAPALSLERDRLAADLSARRALYSSIQQALERAKLDEVRDTPRATVLAPPLPPTGPNARSTLRNGILGFFFGMFVFGFLALAREYFASIPKLESPEAGEFTALRAQSTARLRRPINAVMSAFKRPPTSVH